MVHLVQNEASVPCMKSVSNQTSLLQSDQELALVTVQFIQTVKKMVEGRSFNGTEFKYN
jgi:hypothetical protein